jgi:hypothetical protein
MFPAAILVSQTGGGYVISFADDPTYRSYWHGTDWLLLNSIFLGNQLRIASFDAGGTEEE